MFNNPAVVNLLLDNLNIDKSKNYSLFKNLQRYLVLFRFFDHVCHLLNMKFDFKYRNRTRRNGRRIVEKSKPWHGVEKRPTGNQVLQGGPKHRRVSVVQKGPFVRRAKCGRSSGSRCTVRQRKRTRPGDRWFSASSRYRPKPFEC